jgi:hypothetical protein
MAEAKKDQEDLVKRSMEYQTKSRRRGLFINDSK